MVDYGKLAVGIPVMVVIWLLGMVVLYIQER